MDYIITALISYLFGSIPFGYIFTKIFLKKDIRDVGSGNIGATNVLRTGNKRLGYLTLILDIIKAVIPVIYIKLHYPDLIFISALCAFLGHLFPVWLKFDGRINFKFNLIIHDLKNFTKLISELKQKEYKFKIIRHKNKKYAFFKKLFSSFKKN
ncbi:glycerol-3-phosphate acyltransferase [Candidatus Pelagibacter sp.]|nr:glycerol-3-phosphate acyltransferase [Candidatus Pelagibacter sp.]